MGKSKGSPLKVILTHDVDWPPRGPGSDHVLARRERFDATTLDRVVREGFNPYNNIDLLMDLERDNGQRSTFFFRPLYDDGTPVSEYSDSIRKLVAGGWEVGVHLNDASSLESVRMERDIVGRVCGASPIGCRVHYLRVEASSHEYIKRAGFGYDSSVMYARDEITPRNAGFLMKDGLVVFPITIMDAYLFSYVRVPEERVVEVFESALERCADRGFMTVVWHDSSVLMKGGRAYTQVCEMLASREDVRCVTAREAYLEASGEKN